MKNVFIILSLVLLTSCYKEVNEFPYPEYLGQWKDTISGINFQFNQSELLIGFSKYQYWDIDNTTIPPQLILTQEPQAPPVKTFNIIEKPYRDKKYQYRMVLQESSIKYYLKKY